MFTSCPECGTVFRITTGELRLAEGYVRCGHCAATFNAVATLTDEPPATVTLPDLQDLADALPAADPESDQAPEEPPAKAEIPTEATSTEPAEAPPAATDTSSPDADSERDISSLEFDVPENNWSEFFIMDARATPAPTLPMDDEPVAGPPAEAFRDATDDGEQPAATDAGVFRILPGPAADATAPEDGQEPGSGVVVADEWRELLGEVPGEEDAEPVFRIGEDEPTPPQPVDPEPVVGPEPGGLWGRDLPITPVERMQEAGTYSPDQAIRAERPSGWELPGHEPAGNRTWAYGVGSLLLALALLAQLIHHQRDVLATQPALLEPLSRFYGAFGMTVLPAWDIRGYEVRNVEAIAGRSSRGALDILGRVAIVGTEPVGLPLLRVRLRDRFGKTLGSRVVGPEDYLGEALRPREPIQPGVLIPVRISLKDPGPDAYGYDLDVCLRNRRSGLLCQLERDPFAP